MNFELIPATSLIFTFVSLCCKKSKSINYSWIVFIRYTSVSPSGSVLVWNEAYNSLYDIYSAQGWVSWEGQAIPPEQPFHLHTVVAFVDAEFVGGVLSVAWLYREDFHEIVCRIVVGRTIIAQAWLNVNKKPQYIFQLENDRYQLDR